jgi:hypothetical protein
MKHLTPAKKLKHEVMKRKTLHGIALSLYRCCPALVET